MAVVKKNVAAAVPAVGEEAVTAAPQKVTKINKAVKPAAVKPAAVKAAPPKPAPPKPEVPEVAEPQAKIGRRQLAEAIQAKVKATGKAVPLGIAEIMVAAYEEVIVEAVSQGFEVNLTGFGKYMVIARPETERRNPATGEKFMVPPHNVIRFKVGSSLKAAVSTVHDDGDGDGSEEA